jgi:hypothetical protein
VAHAPGRIMLPGLEATAGRRLRRAPTGSDAGPSGQSRAASASAAQGGQPRSISSSSARRGAPARPPNLGGAAPGPGPQVSGLCHEHVSCGGAKALPERSPTNAKKHTLPDHHYHRDQNQKLRGVRAKEGAGDAPRALEGGGRGSPEAGRAPGEGRGALSKLLAHTIATHHAVIRESTLSSARPSQGGGGGRGSSPGAACVLRPSAMASANAPWNTSPALCGARGAGRSALLVSFSLAVRGACGLLWPARGPLITGLIKEPDQTWCGTLAISPDADSERGPAARKCRAFSRWCTSENVA